MSRTIMSLPPLKPGYWWVNIAPIGDDPKWVQQPAPVSDEGKLFGYDAKTFMAKQYK